MIFEGAPVDAHQWSEWLVLDIALSHKPGIVLGMTGREKEWTWVHGFTNDSHSLAKGSICHIDKPPATRQDS